MNKIIMSALFCFLFVMGSSSHAKSYHLIVCGSGGEEPYEERFEEWGSRLSQALLSGANIAEDELLLLTESGEGKKQSTKETLLSVFEDYATKVTAEDSLVMYIIGHGSFYNAQAKIYLPGDDLRADELAGWLDTLSLKQVAVVNSTSSSAPFINALSAPNRIVCTATKNDGEVNATEFMEWFIQGLEDAKADRNYDEGVTLWEACVYAAEQTLAWYAREGFIATEHPILDDNGDGLGSRLIQDENEENGEQDGALAKQVFIRPFTFSEHVPAKWVQEYRATIEAIETLKDRQSSKPDDDYYGALEKLFIQAATIRRKIRTLEAEGEPDS